MKAPILDNKTREAYEKMAREINRRSNWTVKASVPRYFHRPTLNRICWELRLKKIEEDRINTEG